MRKSVAVVFLVALGLVLNFAVPPFQSPDEPQHLAMILRFSRGGEDEAKAHMRIIRLMDQNSWFQLLGIRRPDVLPVRLEDVRFLIGYYAVASYAELMNNIPLYHFFVGKIIGRLGRGDVSSAYYLARLISFLLFSGALCFLFLTFQLFSRERPRAPGLHWLISGFFFILFLPQLAVTSMAVNPDCLTILLGAIFSYAAFSLLLGRQKPVYYFLLVGSAVAGFLTDRSLLLLLPLAGIGLILLINKKNYQKVIVLTLLAAIAVILLLYFTTLTFPLRIEREFVFARNNLGRTLSTLKSVVSFGEFNRKFLLKMADSFFLRFGWSAFVPGKAFVYAWRMFLGMAILGMGIFFLRGLYRWIKKRLTEDDRTDARSTEGNSEAKPPAGRLIAFSMVAILFQIFAVRVVATPENTYAQGRYLFPLLAPIGLLVMLGTRNFFDVFGEKAKAGIKAVKIVIILEFMFLTYALWSYIFPVFHLTLKSPHPGI